MTEKEKAVIDAAMYRYNLYVAANLARDVSDETEEKIIAANDALDAACLELAKERAS